MLHAKRKKRLTFAGIQEIVSDISNESFEDFSAPPNPKNILFNTSKNGAPLINSTNINESSFLKPDTVETSENDQSAARLFLDAEPKPLLSTQELQEKQSIAEKLDAELDFGEIKENFSKRVEQEIQKEKTRNPRHRRRRSNYLQIRELDQEKQVMVTSTVIDPDGEPMIQDLLVTVIKKTLIKNPKTGEETEFEIFAKQIPGKTWDECTEEELKIIAETDITAKDVLEKIERPAGILPLFFVEYPLAGERKSIRTFGTIGFDNKVNIRDVRRKGFGTGMYPCEFVGSALTGLRCGLSANAANQMRVATNHDLYEFLGEVDFAFSQVLNPENLPGSANQMRNLMQKILSISDEKVRDELKSLPATTLCFDTKGIKFSKHSKDKSKLTKEVLTLLAAGKLDRDDVTIAATGTLCDVDGSEKSAEAIAGTIRAVLEKLFEDDQQRSDFYSKIIACCFDTTSSNTGWRTGACEILQHVLGRCVLMLACRNHIADTAAKHAIF